MATATKKADTNGAATAQWGGEAVEVLTGLTIVDKSTLVDKPFLITGARMISTKETDERESVEMVQVECEIDPRTKEKVYIQDSSVSEDGIKKTIERFMLANGWTGEVDKWYDFRTLCPNGLRPSEFKKKVNGKDVDVTTYYLTRMSNGRG